MIASRHDFANREDLACSLARRVAKALSKAVTTDGAAVLAVSGGETPRLFFDHLSREPITWDKITVTLVDERDVPEDSPRSNARLVKQNLLANAAAKARFVPLYRNPDAGKLPDFAACILGMGHDGHTASFFPNGTTLGKALDPAGTDPLISLSAPGAGEPRLTFTVPRLLAARFLALHIEGQAKQQVLEKALSGPDALEMPVRAVLAAPKPIHVYWCP